MAALSLPSSDPIDIGDTAAAAAAASSPSGSAERPLVPLVALELGAPMAAAALMRPSTSCKAASRPALWLLAAAGRLSARSPSGIERAAAFLSESRIGSKAYRGGGEGGGPRGEEVRGVNRVQPPRSIHRA